MSDAYRKGFDNLIFAHVKFLGFESEPWRRGLGRQGDTIMAKRLRILIGATLFALTLTTTAFAQAAAPVSKQVEISTTTYMKQLFKLIFYDNTIRSDASVASYLT